MYYIEVLRTWRVFRGYLVVLAGLYLLTIVLYSLFPHTANSGDGTLYSAGGHAAVIAFICLLFGSISGSSLSRHLDHLDFALTKPRARTTFVATVFGIDVLALTVFFITTTLAVAALHVAVGETHSLVFDGASWFGILLAFGSVLAWYALVQAISCDRGASGWATAGLWVAGVGLSLLSAANIGPALHALVVTLNFINPIAYLTTVPFEAVGAVPVSLAAHAFAIYAVATAAAVVALIRWQRVEM